MYDWNYGQAFHDQLNAYMQHSMNKRPYQQQEKSCSEFIPNNYPVKNPKFNFNEKDVVDVEFELIPEILCKK